ncbi:peptidylprolyl isomerase [Sphingomicrobium lutaoense]|uniref:Parvulin-like PPIase n=1 Tax=Sphingomicrobium lutaoense TaxID=515949 RepID=A0A839YTL6_9SPHN|nr:peptidylprolyl isomerase [Sphingomicrobium lutaoense]MBB3763611.1 peptidyl-prolyl cis-trans isomerase SurA [Sphingomicrobium lutaoense]
MKFSSLGRRAGAGMVAAMLAATAGAAMQGQNDRFNSAGTLNLPDNPVVYGQALPPVVKATAIINGEVITQTDVEHRLALVMISSNNEVTGEQLVQLRQQVLRNLIDETLQIQAARAEEIEITDAEIDQTLEQVAQRNNRTTDQLGELLRENGSSLRSIRRQVHGEMAWQRLKQAKIESFVSVGDEEVQAVIDRLEASKGTTEYRVAEIFLSATPANDAQVRANAEQILEQLSQGGSFQAYARQFSEASTAAVGGDLGWVRPEQLPPQLAEAVRNLRPGAVSVPIALPGGYSIVAVQDSRTILTADPRNAVLSLKQVSITFPQGTTEAQAVPRVEAFAKAAANIGGCGGADRIANEFGGEVVSSDGVRLRDLPPALEQMMLPMQVGQATQPFGSLSDGVRVLVICGRDEENPGLPSFDQVYGQMNEQRVNSRARRYLRDLRRDAIIDFR